jgi:zinc protease
VYSYLDDGVHSPLWMGALATRNDQVGVSIELLRAELARMAAGEIDEQELQNAKTYLTGSFPLRLTSNDQVSRALAGMQVWQLGIDFLERRNSMVEAVSLDDARRVARRLFDQPLLVAIVGDPQGIDPSL